MAEFDFSGAGLPELDGAEIPLAPPISNEPKPSPLGAGLPDVAPKNKPKEPARAVPTGMDYNKAAAAVRHALIAQVYPESVAGVPNGSVDPHMLVNEAYGDAMRSLTAVDPNVGPLGVKIRATAVRNQTEALKKKQLKKIVDAKDNPKEQAREIAKYNVLHLYDGMPDEVLSNQLDMIDPLAYYAHLQNPTNDPKVTAAQLRAQAVQEGKMNVDQMVSYIGAEADATDVIDTSLIYDMAELMFPLSAWVHAARYGLVKKDVLGDASVTDYILAGNTAEVLGKSMVDMTDEQRKDAVLKFVDSTRETAGDKSILGLSNSVTEYTLMMDALDDIEEEVNKDTSVDWTKVMNNIAGVLGLPLAGGVGGGLLRTTVNLGRATVKMLGGAKAYHATFNAKLLQKLDKGNAELLRVLQAPDTEAEAGLKALAITRKQLVTALLPKPRTATTRDGALPDTLSDAAMNDALISNHLATEIALTPLEQATWSAPRNADDLAKIIKKQVHKYLGVNIDVAKSSFGNVDTEAGTYELKAFIGMNNKSGFTNFGAAEDAIEMWQLGNDAKIYGFDDALGAWKEVDASKMKPTDEGQFYVVKDMKVGFNSDFIGPIPASMRRGATVGGNWVTTGMQRFTGEIREVFKWSVRSDAAMMAKFERALRPYTKLSNKEREPLDKLIYEANGKKTYTIGELRAEGLNENQIVGYLAYRGALDAAMNRVNAAMRAEMMGKGYRAVSVGEGEEWAFRNAGRQLMTYEDALAQIGHEADVLDPSTGLVKKLIVRHNAAYAKKPELALKESDVYHVYAEGGTLVKLDNPVVVNGAEVKYVMAKPGSNVKITDLPPQVINYVPGYMPRFIDHKFVINNADTGQPVAFARDIYEGRAWIRAKETAAKAGEKVPNLEVVPLAEIKAQWGELSTNPFKIENLMFYQERGAALETVDPGNLLSYKDAGSAIAGALDMYTTQVGTGRLIQNFQETWMRDYGKLFATDGFPKDRNVLENLSDIGSQPASRQAVADAIAHWDWVSGIQRAATTYDQKRAKILARWLGQSLAESTFAGKAGRATGRWLMGNPDPLVAAKNTAFVFQILSTPFRYALVNSQTLALHAGIDAGKALRATVFDATYLDFMYYAEKYGVDANKPLLSALEQIGSSEKSILGDTKKDLVALHKAFTSSGYAEIHSQSMSLNRTSMQNMNPISVADSALEQAKQVAAEIAVSATERRVAGSAFSMAARVLSQEIKKPIHQFTRADWKKVVDNAGELSLNFSREDAYNYQRGALSAAMQYMAIRHKALYSMLWGDYQTNRQKAKSALFMLGLFGANGIGAAFVTNQIMNETGVTWDDAVQEMSDAGVFKAIGIGTPPPEKLKQAILGGFTDVLGNAVMAEAVEGDDLLRPPYSNYSASISPMAGLDFSAEAAFAAVHAAFGDGGMAVKDLFLGPAGSAYGNLADVFSTTYSALTDYDTVSDTEKRRIAYSLLGVASGTSNALKSFIAASTGYMVDKRGNKICEITPTEAVSLGLFGMQPEEAVEKYRIQSYLSMDPKAQQESLSAHADELVNEMYSIIMASDDPQAMLDNTAFFSQAVEAYARSPEGNAMLADQVIKGVRNKLSKADEPKNMILIDFLIKKAKANQIDDKDAIFTALLNTNAVQRDPRRKAIIEEMRAMNRDGLQRLKEKVKAAEDARKQKEESE